MPGISQWDALVGDLASEDEFGITDKSDITQSANGSSKRVTFNALLASVARRLSDRGAVSGTVQLDCAGYHTFLATISIATTFEFTDLAVGATIAVVLTNAGSNVSWPSDVDWPYGTAPTLSDTGVDRLVFQRISASVVHGALAGSGYA